MRRTPGSIVSALTLIAVAAFVLHGAKPVVAGGDNDYPFPFETWGAITAVDSGGFTIDRAHFVLPTASMVLPWNPETFDAPAIDQGAIAVGSKVAVYGSLRSDGTVLASSVTAEAEDLNADLVWVAGTIDAVGGGTITVSGTTYNLIDDPDSGPLLALDGSNQGHEITASDLRVGDAIACYEYFNDEHGIRALDEATIHPSGDGASLSGTITASGDEACAAFFGYHGMSISVDGIDCFLPSEFYDSLRTIARPLPDDFVDPVSAIENGDVGVGSAVRLGGRFRDGVFFIEQFHVLQGAAARGAGAVTVTGVVTDAAAGSFAVNGFAIDAPSHGAAKRALRRSPVRVGDRVKVIGRATRDGIVVVQRILHR